MTQAKTVRVVICALFACALFYFFPLVRIRKLDADNGTSAPLKQSKSGGEDPSRGTINVDSFVETLWSERLPKAADAAADINDVFAMSAKEPNGARKKYGRQVGLGGPTFFFVKGHGQIESVDADICRLVIEGQPQQVMLEIGILLSNAVRDATGLIDVGDFPNSQEFNRLSSELNLRCEKKVIKPIRDQLVVGATVEFVGCGEVRDSDGFDPLKLIPVQLKIVKSTTPEEE